eukprot:UN22957
MVKTSFRVLLLQRMQSSSNPFAHVKLKSIRIEIISKCWLRELYIYRLKV